METSLLSDNMLDVLTSVSRWRVVGSAIEPESRPIEDPRHREWMDTHSHSHSYCEMLFVLSGNGCFGYRGNCYNLSPGSLFLLNAMEEHDDYYTTWSPDFDHMWLHFFQDNLIAALVSMHDGVLENKSHLVLVGQTTHWQHSIFSFADTETSRAKTNRLRIYSAVAALMSEIVQTGFAVRTVDDHQSFQMQIISAIELHIRKSCGRGLNVDALAQISGYSKFHFQRLFKQYTGKCVHSYIDQCRLLAVARMTGEGYRKNEIAQELGFSSLSAFSRWHKRYLARNASDLSCRL